MGSSCSSNWDSISTEIANDCAIWVKMGIGQLGTPNMEELTIDFGSETRLLSEEYLLM